MDLVERQKIAALTGHIATQVQAVVGDSWPARRDMAKELIQRVYEAWWNVHARDPNAYERDLNRLNTLTGWSGLDESVLIQLRCPRALLPGTKIGVLQRPRDSILVTSVFLSRALVRLRRYLATDVRCAAPLTWNGGPVAEKIRVAIVGVGNCASSLLQGLEYYRDRKPGEVAGLMHPDVGGYGVDAI